jgi:predicted RNA-binding Zn-ribbon protein involved in translation (DUF1610 family)
MTRADSHSCEGHVASCSIVASTAAAAEIKVLAPKGSPALTGTLTRQLAYTILSLPCPRCGHVLARTGNWFTTAGRYTCAGCKERIHLGYPAKLALFNRHLRALAR